MFKAATIVGAIEYNRGSDSLIQQSAQKKMQEPRLLKTQGLAIVELKALKILFAKDARIQDVEDGVHGSWAQINTCELVSPDSL